MACALVTRHMCPVILESMPTMTASFWSVDGAALLLTNFPFAEFHRGRIPWRGCASAGECCKAASCNFLATFTGHNASLVEHVHEWVCFFEEEDPQMSTFGISGCRVKPRRLWRLQTSTFQGPRASKTTKIQREDPQEREERKTNVAGEEKKKSKILGGPGGGRSGGGSWGGVSGRKQKKRRKKRTNKNKRGTRRKREGRGVQEKQKR